MIYYLRVDVLTNSYQMEGTYKFGRTEDSSGGCEGNVVMQAGKAFGVREAEFPIEEFLNGADCYGSNTLTNNGNII